MKSLEGLEKLIKEALKSEDIIVDSVTYEKIVEIIMFYLLY